MYQVIEYIPYEGQDVSEFDSLEEVKNHIKGHLYPESFNITEIEVVRSIDVYELLGGTS